MLNHIEDVLQKVLLFNAIIETHKLMGIELDIDPLLENIVKGLKDHQINPENKDMVGSSVENLIYWNEQTHDYNLALRNT